MLGFVSCVAVQAKDNPEIAKLAEGVYARIVSPDGNAVGNSGIIVLDRCVLVFDTHFTPEAGRSLLEAVRSITPKPVRYVVNSHAHPDHTHGNQVFADAQIIGSTNARREVMQNDLPSLNRTLSIAQVQLEKLRQEMNGNDADASRRQQLREQIQSREEYVRTMSHLKIMPPIITLDDSLLIQDGKQEIRIANLGPGHTDGDIILFLPSSKITFVGDLFFSEAIPNVQDANILQWMKTLEELLTLDAEKFVPGHGKPGSKKDVAAFLAYFEELKSLVQPAVDRGDSMDQAIKDVRAPSKYSAFRFQNFFPANVQKMYAELKAQQIADASAEPPGKSKSKPAK